MKYIIIQFCSYGHNFALYGILFIPTCVHLQRKKRKRGLLGHAVNLQLHFEIEEWEVYIRATKEGQRVKAKVYVET